MANNGTAAQTVVAANVLVIINSQVVGIATSASWNLDFGVREIRGIDSIIAQEIAPTVYRCTFEISGLRIQQKSLESANIIALPGGNLIVPYISIAILERLSQQALLNIPSAMVDSVKNTVSSKSLMTFELSGSGFVGLSDGTGAFPYTGVPQQIT